MSRRRRECIALVWLLQAGGREEEARRLLVEQWPWGPKRDATVDDENRVALRLFRRLGFSTDDEATWDALPDPLTVYRAENEPGGWCWTTDREYVERARAELPRTDVVERTIRKRDSVAFITQYGESEVVIDPATWRAWEDGRPD